MNRKDFQDIALIRLREAQVLLANGNYDGAYYLCGYIVECGLRRALLNKQNDGTSPIRRPLMRAGLMTLRG